MVIFLFSQSFYAAIMIFSSLFHNCSLLGSDSLSYLFVAFTGRQTIQFLLFFKWQSALDNLSVYFLSLSFFFPLGWLFIQPIAKISPFSFSFFLFFLSPFPTISIFCYNQHYNCLQFQSVPPSFLPPPPTPRKSSASAAFAARASVFRAIFR